MSRLVEVTATGDVTTATAHLHSVVLTGGSDAATLVVKEGGSGGTTILSLKAPANTSVFWEAGDSDGVQCSGGIHATTTGTGETASFEYR